MAEFTIKQGDDWSHTFRIQRKLTPIEIWRAAGNTGDEEAYAAALGLKDEAKFVASLGVSEHRQIWNLAGLTVTYQLRAGDNLAAQQPSVTVASATYGRVKLSLTGDQTAQLLAGNYIGQLQIKGQETHSADPDGFTLVKDVNIA